MGFNKGMLHFVPSSISEFCRKCVTDPMVGFHQRNKWLEGKENASFRADCCSHVIRLGFYHDASLNGYLWQYHQQKENICWLNWKMTNSGVIFQPELHSMGCISLVKFHHISAVLTSNSFLAIPLWARRISAVCWL